MNNSEPKKMTAEERANEDERVRVMFARNWLSLADSDANVQSSDIIVQISDEQKAKIRLLREKLRPFFQPPPPLLSTNLPVRASFFQKIKSRFGLK